MKNFKQEKGNGSALKWDCFAQGIRKQMIPALRILIGSGFSKYQNKKKLYLLVYCFNSETAAI